MSGGGMLPSDISIHALTRSATIHRSNCHVSHSHFNPRTHEECDGKRDISALKITHFNPRTHEECDCVEDSRERTLVISIHALTRSATAWLRYGQIGLDFNPRTHEECDIIQPDISRQNDFNPRTHEECDVSHTSVRYLAVFQSTHSRGVRRSEYSAR